ncbi:tRNA pseudouridine(38-40) synthase TruA [Arthrobacter sp. UM1]|nr:tRNA pseudouridine(38-40) synthase TruA [Arthrobacter sp. UM1]
MSGTGSPPRKPGSFEPAAGPAPSPASGSAPATGGGEAEPRLRLALTLGYDGTDFHGWASQPGLRTVQSSLEDSLAMILRRDVRVVVAGRTDTGVHARRQVVHTDVTEAEAAAVVGRSGLPLETALLRRIDGTLARVLGSLRGAVVVHRVRTVPPAFDARFSALDRTYVYRVSDSRDEWDPLTRRMTWWVPQELDVEVMHAAAQRLTGLHDFLSFCKPREGATTIRGLHEASVRRADTGIIEIRLRADAFCHHMVRNIVAALVGVGSGRDEPEVLSERLDGRRTGRLPAMAPPHGLTLDSIGYPGDEELEARNLVTRALRE